MEPKQFKIGIDFQSILRAISKQIYETPLAFIRENVQNAVDAIRIQALREEVAPGDARFYVEVDTTEKTVSVRDNGIGMSASELQDYFWTIGASGKKTDEAQKAGCVGMFGIGGFANFGICHSLEVISQSDAANRGTLTKLSELDIEQAGAAIPSVTIYDSDLVSPRGTLVIGHMRHPVNVSELESYLKDFVRFVPTKVLFNDRNISQEHFSNIEDRDNLSDLHGVQKEWSEGTLRITGRLFEDNQKTIIASINGLLVDNVSVALDGLLRFENGAIDVYKRGFKLCATQIPTMIGVKGRLDCDLFIPTAGRDSLDSTTMALLSKVISLLENVVVETVLESSERIAQHTRIFRYIINHGMIDKLDRVRVSVGDGSEIKLGDIRNKVAIFNTKVYFGTTIKQTLHQLMHARGHVVVTLSSDYYRQQAERIYLERHCLAKAFDGVIECIEYYTNLTRFENIFLSELEFNITKGYEVQNYQIQAGKLTEDVPVYVKDSSGTQSLTIFVDVRHSEITKLQSLGYGQLLYSMISAFSREYLGPSLKRWSPKFFGDGALNLNLLSKQRSELWILLKDDVGVVRKGGGQRHVVTRSDVGVVHVSTQNTPAGQIKHRIIEIIDEQGTTGVAGFYIRLPDSAFRAYGDLFAQCEHQGVVWAGNKIQYVISDAVSSAFQYEIRLDEIITGRANGKVSVEGALPLQQPLQQMFEGIYFPIPTILRSFLVPVKDQEIRIELHCDWMDMRTSAHWVAKNE